MPMGGPFNLEFTVPSYCTGMFMWCVITASLCQHG